MDNAGARKTIKAVEEELKKHFAEVETKCGVKLNFGRGSFTSGNFTVKLEGVFSDGKSKDAELYDNSRVMLGLPPLNTILDLSGKKHRITGVNTTGTKVKTECQGKFYLVPIAYVKLLWGSMKE